jgi:phage gpG-like protein
MLEISLQFDSLSELENAVMAAFEKAKVPCQAAMANRFASIVHHNFGFGGEDRPFPWPALNAHYADVFHGGQRIPTEILSGDMQASVQIDETNADAAKVWTDCEYAGEQQWGTQSVRARPFFPMYKDGSVTPYALDEVIRAAQNEAERILQ